jgi:integrase
LKRGLISSNPFLIYGEKLIIQDAVFLTKDELERIENKKFTTKRLDRVKDIFIFSCYTSYAPIDVENLAESNLVKDNEGAFWIKTNRAKTRIKSNVPVLPPVKRIIDKYAHLEGSKLLPRISNQKINEYLKEIAVLCKIDKKLTHYVARHTFATTVTLGNGVGIENVSKMMGHTRISMTQHYAKVLDSNVKKDMDKLKNKFC